MKAFRKGYLASHLEAHFSSYKINHVLTLLIWNARRS